MAGIQDFCIFEDDFLGGRTVAATVGEGDFKLTQTAAGGSPTCALVTPSALGELAMTLAATSEVENMCVSFGDKLCFDIDNLQRFECRVKVSGCTTGTTTTWGLGTARNDTPTSMTSYALLQMVGATSTTAVTVLTGTASLTVSPVTSGQTLATTYKKFVIDFTGGTANVKFYIDGIRVGASTTFNMSGYTGSFQPYFQIQKAANTNVDSVTIDYIKLIAKRF